MELSDNPAMMLVAMFFVGIAFAAAFIALLVMAWVWSRVYAWIDDSKPAKHNPLTVFLMKRWGCSPRSHGSDYEDANGDYVSVESKLSLFLLAIICTPPALFLAIKLYPLALTIVTLILMAHLARFALRAKKLFDKHLTDPNAHK